MDKGKIYILKNQHMPNIYKIGLTRVSVENRIRSLSATSVPSAFICVHQFDCDHVLKMERHIHNTLQNNRVTQKREFFIFATDSAVIEAVNKASSTFTQKPYTKKEKIIIDCDQERVGEALYLMEYINRYHNGSQARFARYLEVKPPQISQWIDKKFIVVDHVLYSPRRELVKA